ncbi:HAD family hydrolase [Vibrio sp.]|nr:HAD family hydrolase [Vibrio sp.]
MPHIYLFDWGNTLMFDCPNQNGKMKDWAVITPIHGAREALQSLSQNHKVYVATNAVDSSESDIQSAFERAGLAPYITGYFCKENLGIGKGTVEFFEKILTKLNTEHQHITMVGDSYSKDIQPALEAKINAIWFNPNNNPIYPSIKQIRCLTELCQ